MAYGEIQIPLAGSLCFAIVAIHSYYVLQNTSCRRDLMREILHMIG